MGGGNGELKTQCQGKRKKKKVRNINGRLKPRALAVSVIRKGGAKTLWGGEKFHIPFRSLLLTLTLHISDLRRKKQRGIPGPPYAYQPLEMKWRTTGMDWRSGRGNGQRDETEGCVDRVTGNAAKLINNGKKRGKSNARNQLPQSGDISGRVRMRQ